MRPHNTRTAPAERTKKDEGQRPGRGVLPFAEEADRTPAPDPSIARPGMQPGSRNTFRSPCFVRFVRRLVRCSSTFANLGDATPPANGPPDVGPYQRGRMPAQTPRRATHASPFPGRRIFAQVRVAPFRISTHHEVARRAPSPRVPPVWSLAALDECQRRLPLACALRERPRRADVRGANTPSLPASVVRATDALVSRFAPVG